MITDALDAWLLAKTPSGDSSLRLHLFTREQGIVSCFYKGGRTPKKQAVLQAFLPLCLSLDSRRDCHFVRSIETPGAALPLAGHALFSALYVNELIHHALKPFDPHPDVFETYQYTLQGLTLAHERLTLESLLRRFEWVLLRDCGHRLAFVDDKVAPFYQFVAGSGFVSAPEGFPHDTASAIIAGEFHDVRVVQAAKRTMRQAVDYLLAGRELKSRQLFGTPRVPQNV
ncbi:DNA repair protein RecO [Legionella sp. CNM-4043-24]|uniref:DNA repair protein RecO n=1 Tax=Legionella sp. CNM-4043-24 TaxID=3421646 RepID=UPI00403A9EB8